MWRTQWLSTRTNTLQGKGYLFTVSHFVALFFWIPWRTIWSWFVEFVIFLGGTLSLFQLNISVYWTSWILLLKKLANKSHIHCRHWDKFTIQLFCHFDFVARAISLFGFDLDKLLHRSCTFVRKLHQIHHIEKWSHMRNPMKRKL